MRASGPVALATKTLGDRSTRRFRIARLVARPLRDVGRRVAKTGRRLSGRTPRVRVGAYTMHVPDDMEWAFRGGDYYEHNVIVWMDRLLAAAENPVFYDVGANYGYYTLRLAARAEHVYAFEPVTRTADRLRRNVASNGIRNVTVCQIGLWDSPEATEINLYSSSGNNSLFRQSAPPPAVELIGRETVRLARLDDVIRADGLRAPGVMKLDIEGGELYALRGAAGVLAASRPSLVIEFDEDAFRDADYTRADLVAELDRYGYSVFGLSIDARDEHLYSRTDFPNLRVENIVAVIPDLVDAIARYQA